jgi:hypothetical protein
MLMVILHFVFIDVTDRILSEGWSRWGWWWWLRKEKSRQCSCIIEELGFKL